MTGIKDGLFIAFEGGDGAGKSTQAARLTAWLTIQGYQARPTFEPGDTVVGARVRQMVLHDDLALSPRAETLLYAVDKAQHVAEVVQPALTARQVVVCDRYVDSTIAYQGAGRTLNLDEVSRIAWWSVGDLRPDLTVVMDVPVSQAFASLENPDRMEAAGEAFHERVRHHFLSLAEAHPQRYLVVNGRAPKDDVTHQICQRVRNLIETGRFNLERLQPTHDDTSG